MVSGLPLNFLALSPTHYSKGEYFFPSNLETWDFFPASFIVCLFGFYKLPHIKGTYKNTHIWLCLDWQEEFPISNWLKASLFLFFFFSFTINLNVISLTFNVLFIFLEISMLDESISWLVASTVCDFMQNSNLAYQQRIILYFISN